LSGRADDGGVYLPDILPVLPDAFFNNIGDMSLTEIAYVVSDRLFSDDIDSTTIKRVVDSALNFPVKVVNIEPGIYAMELFHGPTLAFKDFGARFMGRLFEFWPSIDRSRKFNIVVSTTGNTGGAIANAFAGVSAAEVFILFPPNPGNRSLERQFTTLGGNIHPVEVQGSIDDCARLAMQALTDVSLQRQALMISANSANIMRLLPETFYYFYGMGRLLSQRINLCDVALSIPCGNMGNLTAAVMAHRMGLPMAGIVACENANATLATAMKTGRFSRRKSQPTLAYAADKGRPSNHSRISALFGGDVSTATSTIIPHCCDDAHIISSVNGCLHDNGYLLDPHSAMAYDGLKSHLRKGQTGLMLATAHPAKSLTTMTAITGRALDLPLQLTAFMTGRDHRVRIPPIYSHLKTFIEEINDHCR